ncbi:SpoIIE family protein phosphatase [candidate division KSB1 bacterium]|nr:SpoIIE family protein phosphatase [candidate division KSB1 bacterium]
MKKRILFFIFPALLFVAIFVSDFHRVQSGEILITPLAREILITCSVLILALQLIWDQKNRQKDLIAQMQGLGLSIILLWIPSFIIQRQVYFDTESFGLLAPFDLFIWTILAIAFVVLLFRILMYLKFMIYIQQSRNTQRNFHFFFICVLLLMLFDLNISTGRIPEGITERILFFGRSLWRNILMGGVILSALINGLRCKWIHYLKRGQKWLVLILLAFIYPFSMTFLFALPEAIDPYSQLLGTFAVAVVMFWAIYGAMAIGGVLVQLPTAGLMDRRVEEIASLQSLSATIGSIFDVDQLIVKTLAQALRVVGADYAWLELKEGDGFRIAGREGIRENEIDSLPIPGLVPVRDEVLQKESVLLINNIARDKRTEHWKRWRKVRAGSLLAARLQYKDHALGVLYAVREYSFGFVEESRGLFKAFADQVAIAIENAHLVELSIEQEGYRQELRLAHEAQMRLLPRSMPEIKGAEVEGLCLTANDIGGDFYDVIPVSSNRVDILVGDVSGKGASAAFYMAELKGVVQTLAHLFTSPTDIVAEVNTFIRNQFEPGMFVTLIYSIYLPVRKELQIVRAGHLPAIHITQDQVHLFESAGLGLGLVDTVQLRESLEESHLKLEDNQAVVLYSDGVIEARNRKGEEYGEFRFQEDLFDVKALSCQTMMTELRRRFESFMDDTPMHDDLTMVILKT